MIALDCRKLLAAVAWITFSLSLSAAPILTPSPTLTLTPSPNLVGAPGSTVGWGFTITNDLLYIQITGARFCLNPVSLPACTGSTTGTFTDFIGSNNIVVGFPSGTLPDTASQPFSLGPPTGIGSFLISPSALHGQQDLGTIVLTYTVTTLDPTDPDAVVLATDQILSANASVTVDTSVPEPGTITLMSFGAALLAVHWWRRRAAV